jgi:hypothetical protein
LNVPVVSDLAALDVQATDQFWTAVNGDELGLTTKQRIDAGGEGYISLANEAAAIYGTATLALAARDTLQPTTAKAFAEEGITSGRSNVPAKYDPEFALRQGADPKGVVPDSYYVVRGGQSSMPPAGTVFSGSAGSSVAEVASGVPHGSVRVATAGQIRVGGGVVELKPELTRSGIMNIRHVNVTEQGATVFEEIIPNPVPKDLRIR